MKIIQKVVGLKMFRRQKYLVFLKLTFIQEEDHNYVFAIYESEKERMQIEKFKVNVADRNEQAVLFPKTS